MSAISKAWSSRAWTRSARKPPRARRTSSATLIRSARDVDHERYEVTDEAGEAVSTFPLRDAISIPRIELRRAGLVGALTRR